MDVADYLLGCLALAVGLLPWVRAARRLARRLQPALRGAEHALASSIVGVGGVVVTTELVAICDGLRRWPWTVVSAVVALAVGALGSPPSAVADRRAGLPTTRSARITLACVAVCIVATSASLLGRAAAVAGTGPLDTDSLDYHLTQAAQMVHVHNIDRLHQTSSSAASVTYPYDAELLDAVGMLGPHPDLADLGLNVLFGWLALLACWVIGARWQRGAAALAAGAAAIAVPIVSQASSGPGLNDLPTLAFVLSALAFVVHAGLPRGGAPRRAWLGELALAGAAMGLAAGTKLNALAFVVLLAVAAVVLARRDRGATAAALAGPALLTGGFWYVRDWVETGSPVPSVSVTVAGHGFHGIPYPEARPQAFTVAHYLGDSHVIHEWFVPGLHAAWTILWPVVALLAIAGLALAIFRDGSWLRRAIGVVVVVDFFIYLVTPTSAQGPPGQPVLFASNTRYVLPVVAAALVLLASSPTFKRLAMPLTVGFTALTLGELASSTTITQVRFSVGLAAALGLGVVILAGRALLRRAAGMQRAIAAGIAVVAVVGAGALAQHHYVQHRYAGPDPVDRLFASVGSLNDTRIGVAGFSLAYPFFGDDFSNTVNYVGYTAPAHAFLPPTSCAQLVSVLVRLHDDYLVVEPLARQHTDRLAGWLLVIPGVVELSGNSAGTVYKLPATISDSGCSM